MTYLSPISPMNENSSSGFTPIDSFESDVMGITPIDNSQFNFPVDIDKSHFDCDDL